MTKLLPLAFAPFLLAAACGPPPPEPTLANVRAVVFEPRCSATVCHGGPNGAGELDLATDPHAALVDVDSVGEPGVKRVVPGDPDSSLLYQVLLGTAETVPPMPSGLPARSLPEDEIELVRAWIEAGAPKD